MYLKKVSALSMLLASCYANAGVVDTIEAPTGFFLPVPAVFNSTYLRGSNQDWEWKHNAISGAYTTAELFISAYDVDQAQGEVDNIYAWDLQGNAGAGAWSLLGALNGLDNDYGYTTFNLSSPTWLDEINVGIMLKIDIDATNAG